MVDWGFLQIHAGSIEVQRKMGRLGFLVVSSARFSILINGSPKGFFKVRVGGDGVEMDASRMPALSNVICYLWWRLYMQCW